MRPTTATTCLLAATLLAAAALVTGAPTLTAASRLATAAGALMFVVDTRRSRRTP